MAADPKLIMLSNTRPRFIPTKPTNIISCERCGTLKNEKHTGWLCRFLRWIDNK